MIKVGQQLYFVSGSTSPFYVTVTKIGRRWIHASYNRWTVRLSTETLHSHEDDISGKAWVSKDEYEAKVALAEEWRSFIVALAKIYSAPPDVTVERIRQARELLGI